MDVVRVRSRHALPWRRILSILALLLAAAGALWSLALLSHVRAEAPAIDRATIVTDRATRGPLTLTVPAQGVFAAERVRVIAAPQAGVVDTIFVKDGTFVRPGTLVAQLENPALVRALGAARSALAVETATLESEREQSRSLLITSQTAVDDAEATQAQAELDVRTDAKLLHDGYLGRLPYEKAVIESDRSRTDLRRSREQLLVAAADARAKIAAAQARVDDARAQVAAVAAQLDGLAVRAASGGVVQSVDVDPGTSIAQSTEIARVADVRDLKAVLQVAESDLPSIAPGMAVSVTGGAGSAIGRIARVAPAAHGGTVGVDVTFPSGPPPGALLSANVSATIRIATIANAVSIARPAGAADNAPVTLFRVVDGGTRAERIQAQLGRGTDERVRVLRGVAPGDTVIVSDPSAFADQPVIRLR